MSVERNGKTRSYRCHLDRWLDEIMCIKGLPIPYGAPNASPHVERFNRTLREEALNHFIFLSVDHIRRVAREYIRSYSGARPSQAIHWIPGTLTRTSDNLRHRPVSLSLSQSSVAFSTITDSSRNPSQPRRCDDGPGHWCAY